MHWVFCTLKSALGNPNLRTGGALSVGQTFAVMEYGECEGNTGYWAEDLDTLEEGFLDEYEDVFWVYDEVSTAWLLDTSRDDHSGNAEERAKAREKAKAKRDTENVDPLTKVEKERRKGNRKHIRPIMTVQLMQTAPSKDTEKDGPRGKARKARIKMPMPIIALQAEKERGT